LSRGNPAETIRKLVTLAASGDTPEARSAAAMARKQIMALDTELLSTLEGQRASLVEQLRHESRRLSSARERATKQETGELVSDALVLFNHYRRIDVLIPVAMLLRIEDGRALTNDERQQLDGPVDSLLDRWFKASRERQQAEREQRRAEARRKRREAQTASARQEARP
jgi:hypothetical protein